MSISSTGENACVSSRIFFITLFALSRFPDWIRFEYSVTSVCRFSRAALDSPVMSTSTSHSKSLKISFQVVSLISDAEDCY